MIPPGHVPPAHLKAAPALSVLEFLDARGGNHVLPIVDRNLLVRLDVAAHNHVESAVVEAAAMVTRFISRVKRFISRVKRFLSRVKT